MSIEPKVVTQDEVVEQVKDLQTEKNSLDTQIDVLDRKLASIKASLAENDDLRSKNKDLLEQVLKLFAEEWARRAEYYPDIRLEVLMKSAALNAPAKKEGT